MRMLIHVKFPNEPFNTHVRSGAAGKLIERVMGEVKPEAAYFTEYDGKRGAIMIVDIADPSRIPAIAEPFFLLFNAELSAHIVMNPDDLAKSGLDAIGKKWA